MDLILIAGVVIILSVLSCKLTNKIGLPLLVGFIALGAVIGTKFSFEKVEDAEALCNLALLFILFTGGFQTDFRNSRKILGVATVLSTVGTVVTAGAIAAFAYFIFGFEFYQAMLLGAVMSCTDAASVFSVLSSKKIRLKSNLGEILEMESGTNDPVAYMLTVVFIGLAQGGLSFNLPLILFLQIVFGVSVGVVVSALGQRFINKLNLDIDGLYAVLICGVALLTYGLATTFGGNGFLAVYIGGMILGNSELVHKKLLSRLLGSVAMMFQIMLFIVLGLLFVPGEVAAIAGVGVMVGVIGFMVAAFIFFVARPLVTFMIMRPFGYRAREIAVTAWCGFRGASSIVFATYLLSAKLPYAEIVFGIVFVSCLLSVTFKGLFLVPFVRRMKMADDEQLTVDS